MASLHVRMKQERSLLFQATLFYVPDFGYQRNRFAIICECHSDINCIIITLPTFFPIGNSYERINVKKKKLFLRSPFV